MTRADDRRFWACPNGQGLLRDMPANNLHAILRDCIVEDCEGAPVDGATGHRGSAFEIVVNGGLVVEIQPVLLLLRSYDSVAVGGLDLGVVTVFRQHVNDPVRCSADMRLW